MGETNTKTSNRYACDENQDFKHYSIERFGGHSNCRAREQSNKTSHQNLDFTFTGNPKKYCCIAGRLMLDATVKHLE
jgi:hypothetical protein